MVPENETSDLVRDKKQLFNIFIKSLVEMKIQQHPVTSSVPSTTTVF